MVRNSNLKIYLTTLFVSSLLISNVITSKQVLMPFGLTISGAVFIFPITYILSDIFSEVYGYKWSRITCYLAFVMNALMVLVFEIVIKSPAPFYWNNQEAFEVVLGSSPRILFASLSAFILGDLANDLVFDRMKLKHKKDHKKFGVRAIVSSLIGEIADSMVFVPLAFLGTMPVPTLLTMIGTQVVLKTSYEIIILPITTLLMNKVSKYEENVNEL